MASMKIFALFFLISISGLNPLPFSEDVDPEKNPLPQEDNPSFIVGGHEAADHEVPYQIALYSGGDFVCSGSLIGLQTVLTAAHCVYG